MPYLSQHHPLKAKELQFRHKSVELNLRDEQTESKTALIHAVRSECGLL